MDDLSNSRSGRSYTAKTLKLLWGRAAGRCAMPNCRVELFDDIPGYDPVCSIGEMGHIAGSSDRGPRADTKLGRRNRDDYENLILLCRNCHARIDSVPQAYPVDVLNSIKRNHEAWVRSSLPERGLSAHGWSVIQLRGEYPYDATSIPAALNPDHARTERRFDVRPRMSSWAAIKSAIRQLAEDITNADDPDAARLAIFPLAPVSACIFLGYALTNRINAKLFQYHRDAATWCWPKNADSVESPSISVQTKAEPADAQVCFLFELSARIDLDAISEIVPGTKTIYVLGVANPTTSWLQQGEQIVELGSKAREIFEKAAIRHPKARLWHVFYAGPAPGAVAVGQQLNPTMVPTVQLYEFLRPKHIPSILIESSDSKFASWQEMF